MTQQAQTSETTSRSYLLSGQREHHSLSDADPIRGADCTVGLIPAGTARISCRVLLVQNDATLADVITRMLSQIGDVSHEVEWVRHCEQAEQALHSRRFRHGHSITPIDAVILDLRLPHDEGLDAVKRLRLACPQTPILVVAPAHDEPVARNSILAGARDYLLTSSMSVGVLNKALITMIYRARQDIAVQRESEQWHHTLEELPAGVIRSDPYGNIEYMNHYARQTTGWPAQEAVGLPLHTVLRLSDPKTGLAVAVRAPHLHSPLEEPPREDQEVVLVRRDGQRVPLEVHSQALQDARAQTCGTLVWFHDVSAATRRYRMARHSANHDTLTGLPRRSVLEDRLRQALVQAPRHRQQVAVMFMDIDRFKSINDSFGHAVGDDLLKSVAERLMHCVRASDTICRIGGDEFVILLPVVSTHEVAGPMAAKILEAIRQPHALGDLSITVTASIGIASQTRRSDDELKLLNAADMAMYRAKQAGGDQYHFAHIASNTAQHTSS